MADVTLEMLQVLIQRSLDEQKTLRREVGEVRSLAVALAEQGRRIERRVAEVRDDIEVMVKAELMGRLGHFEAQLEARLESIEDRLAPQ